MAIQGDLQSGPLLSPGPFSPTASWRDIGARSGLGRQCLVLACGATLALLLLSASLLLPASPSLLSQQGQQLQTPDQENLPLPPQQVNPGSTSPAWLVRLHRDLQPLASTLLACGHSPGTPTGFLAALCRPWRAGDTSDSGSRGDSGSSGLGVQEAATEKMQEAQGAAQREAPEESPEEARETAKQPLPHWLPVRWKPEAADVDSLPPTPDMLDVLDVLDMGFKAPPSEEPTVSDHKPESKSKSGAYADRADKSHRPPPPPPPQMPREGKGSSSRVGSSIPQALVRHVAFPGAAQCGAWASDFARLQREIRSLSAGSSSGRRSGREGASEGGVEGGGEGGNEGGSEGGSGGGSGGEGGSGSEGGGVARRKYLTFESPLSYPGLGDRLVGLVSSFLVALLTRRAFILADPFLAAVFDPAEIDWRVRDDVPMPVTTSSMKNVSEGCVLRVYAHNGLRSGIFPLCPECRGMVGDIAENFQGTEPAANIVLHINRGVLSFVFGGGPRSLTRQLLEDMGLSYRNAFACILRFLLRPKREVLRLAARPAQALLRPQARSICLHLRTHDDYAWPSREALSNDSYMAAFRDRVEAHLEPLLQCVQRLEDQYGKKAGLTWFLISDAGAVTSSVVRRYGKKVLTSGLIPTHPKISGMKGMTASAVEWLLFSTCKFYVIVESGLSKSAYAYNLHPAPLFIFNRLDVPMNVHRECDLTKPLNASDLGNWSGL